MALSQDLINQFAKLTVKEEKPKEVTVNGIYKVVNGEEFVQIDGSDILTPVNSTVEAETGERVKVLIKNHTATVTGNISSPSARSKSVQDLKDEVDEQGNTIKQLDNSIEQQGNSIIQINNNIKQVENDILQANNAINQQGNQITQINNDIEQQGNQITQINNDIEQKSNEIKQINNTITQQNNTIIQQGNTITQQGNIITQQGNIINQQGNIINEHGNNIEVFDSNIKILNSGFVIENGVLKGLSEIIVNALQTDHLNAKYANIDFTNINYAAVQKIFSESGIIKDLIVQEGKITGELVGVTIKGDLIEGNTIKAEKLVVKGEDGLYYKLNTTGETVEAEQTIENSLNGSVITAKSITASKIQVTDLVAFGATIGGFDISDDSIHSHLKPDIDSPNNGLFLGSDGQMALGNDRNHIKYYKDENDNYILDVRLDKLYLGASQQTADQQFQGMVEISANNLTSVFKTSGGSNLLRNSVGYAGTDFWLTAGNITTNQNDDMSLSGSEFILTNDASLEQIYSTQPGTLYSIAFKYKHTVVGSANRVKVEITGNGNTKTILDTTEAKSEWTTVTLDEPYEATTNSPKIIISCAGDDILEITDLIISQGTNDVWSGFIDEVYGKKHQLDANGLRLYSETSNRSTNTTSTSYQLKDGSNVIGELTRERVYSQMGEFDQGTKIGRLRTVVLDNNNIIEYI